MGAAASKSAKPSTLAKTAIPSMPQAKYEPPPPPQQPRKAQTTEAAQDLQDAMAEPSLAARLSQLGPVEVPHIGTPINKSNKMLDILSIRRAEAEQFETQGRLVDRLSARSLSNYLDDRKTLATHAERADLAKQYGISVALLEDLAKHVNSPSVSNVPLRASGTVEDDLEETQLAMWVDPPAEGKKAIA